MRNSDWSSDVCSSDLRTRPRPDDRAGLSSVSNSFVMRTLGISPALSGDKLGPRCKLPNRNANPAQQGALFPRSQKCRAIKGYHCTMLIGRWLHLGRAGGSEESVLGKEGVSTCIKR